MRIETHTSMSDDERCVICLSSLTEGYNRVTRCHHTFHASCVREWENSQFAEGSLYSTCPICRANVHRNPRPRVTHPIVIIGMVVNGHLVFAEYEVLIRPQ